MFFDSKEIKRRNNSLDYKVSKQNLLSKENICNGIQRNYSFVKKRNVSSNNFIKMFTSICKKFYPLTMVVEKTQNYCKKHHKIISFFCFTCNSHLCLKCKSEHINHSLESFDKLKFNEENLLKEEKSIPIRASLLFNSKSNKNIDKKILEKLKNEIMNFNYFIIDSYRKENNNFYNFFNYYYCFKLKEDLKSKENDLLKNYFGLYGFKKMIQNLQLYYEKVKYIWLLRNLVAYKKYDIKKKKISKRKKKYNFLNIYILLQNEGYDERIVNKMKEIIEEINDKKRNDLKKKYLIL